MGSGARITMLRGLGARYMACLREHPVKTNFVTGGFLATLGDVICQFGVERQEKLDLKRNFAMAMFGFFYNGHVSYRIYCAYPSILQRFAPSLMKTPLREGIASSSMDNFIHVPFLYTPAFYAITEMLQGRTAEEAKEAFVTCAIPSMVACWGMWIPYQTVNFGFIPPANRTAFMNVGCLAWNVILDYIANNTAESATPDSKGVAASPKQELAAPVVAATQKPALREKPQTVEGAGGGGLGAVLLSGASGNSA